MENVKGCGEMVHVMGTSGGKMPCGAVLRDLEGNESPYFCPTCQPRPKFEIPPTSLASLREYLADCWVRFRALDGRDKDLREEIGRVQKEIDRLEPPAPEGLYFYKDTFLTGAFGVASRGSYVISNRELNRPDFRLMLGANKLADMPVADGSARAFQLWIDPETPKGSPAFSAELEWVGGKAKLRLQAGERAKAAEGRTAEEFDALWERLARFGAF